MSWFRKFSTKHAFNDGANLAFDNCAMTAHDLGAIEVFEAINRMKELYNDPKKLAATPTVPAPRGPVWCWYCGVEPTAGHERKLEMPCIHRDNPTGLHEFVKVTRAPESAGQWSGKTRRPIGAPARQWHDIPAAEWKPRR